MIYIESNNKLNKRGKSKTNTTRNKSNSPSKPSLFSHKMITKKDITLLSRRKMTSSLSYNKQSHDHKINYMEEEGMCDVKYVKPLKSITVDSIPPNESNLSDVETMESQDPDVLFSPYYDSFDRDSFFEEEMYNKDIIYNDNNHYSSLKKFQNNQTFSTPTSTIFDITNSDSHALGLPLQLFDEIEDEDFWKEVKGTDEDIIPINGDCYNNDEIKSNKSSSVVSYNVDNSSIENFLSDEYLTTSSVSGSACSSTMGTDIFQYNIRLLCYRDADGKLALKTTNQLKNNCSDATDFTSNNATDLVGSKKINKKNELLKKAIRRKSAFSEMILRSVEMNEFML